VRVLHTVHEYPPSVGGSEAVVQRLSEGLLERGHEVEVATSPHEARGQTVDEVPVHEFAQTPWGALAYRRFVRQGLDGDRWDVVMTYHSKVFPHLALAPFRGLDDVWVYCPTEFTDIDSPMPRHLLYYRTVEPWSIERSAATMVLTERDRERAHEIAEVAEDHVRVIPNGVDADYWIGGEAGSARERFDLPSDAPIALYVGGIWEHKRVDQLVDAVASLDDVHLALAGDPRGNRDEIEARAEDREIDDRVHVLGRVERDALRSLYQAVDVFASASENEGFGLVYLEAMACGLPVAARPVGVVPDLVDDDAVLQVANSVGSLARAIRELVDADGSANVDVARAYDWENVLDELEALYEEVAE
jgi:glycosyltransferase involved in cell wall biosynthesis